MRTEDQHTADRATDVAGRINNARQALQIAEHALKEATAAAMYDTASTDNLRRLGGSVEILVRFAIDEEREWNRLAAVRDIHRNI